LVKIYCDNCGEEITGVEYGSFGFIEKVKTFNFIKHQPKEGEQVVKKEYALCPACVKKVSEVLNLQ